MTKYEKKSFNKLCEFKNFGAKIQIYRKVDDILFRLICKKL